MNRKPRKSLIAVLLTLASMIAATLALTPTASAADGARPNWSKAGQCVPQSPQWAAQRNAIADLKASGKLSAKNAATLMCHPDWVLRDLTVTTRVEPVPSTATTADATTLTATATYATRCTGFGLIATGSSWGADIWTYKNTLNWCYNGSRVSNVSQVCSGNVTTWGKLNFVSYDGTVEKDLIYYTYGGLTGAAVHSRCKGKFTAVKFAYAVYPLLSVWGHPDGTLDYKVYPY